MTRNLTASNFDDCIRTGRHTELRMLLSEEFKQKDLSRDDVLLLATYANRVGMPQNVVNSLHAHVYGPSPHQREYLEYGLALSALGAEREGRQFLSRVDTRECPQGHLFRAFADLNAWEFESALTEMNSYLQLDISSAERLIAEINKIAILQGLAQSSHPKAQQETDELLRQVRVAAKQSENLRLKIRVIQMGIRQSLLNKDLERAQFVLKEYENFLQTVKSTDMAPLRRWRAMIRIFEEVTPSTIEGLKSVRKEAERSMSWESVREIDRALALTTQDHQVFHQLYFASRLDAQKKSILKQFQSVFGSQAKIVDSASVFLADNGARENLPWIEIPSGRNSASTGVLKAGKLMSGALRVLASDRYVPFTVPMFFGDLFPDQNFHPIHSPNAIHQAFFRLRQWIDAQSFPLQIVNEGGRYRLHATQPIELKYVTDQAAQTADLVSLVGQIGNLIQGNYFSLDEVAKSMEMPRRTLTHYIKRAVDHSLIEKVGAGRSTRYRLVA